MGKKSFSRVDAEKAEGLDVVKNDVPENRLQADQQINDSAEAEKVKAPNGSFNTKKTKGKGAQLKQQAISEALTGASDSSGMGITAAGRSVSGTNGGILGASNSTPVAGKARSETRIGKKLDRVANKLNYTPSEQVLIEFDESKPLADAAAEDQGFNGTYRNEFARSQKIMGAVPGDLMFQRSVDLIAKDKLYYVEGQHCFQVADDRVKLNPTRMFDYMRGDVPVYKDVEYKSGNYLHKGLSFGLTPAGKVRYFFADVEDLTHGTVSVEDANIVSAHKLIKQNVAELDRIAIDAKAGDEKAELWTPLARAVEQPTELAYIMSSIEADTGAYAYLAYSKATTNLAYQLNRGPKDGLDVVTPAIEELIGWRNITMDSKTINSDNNNTIDGIFSTANYVAADPALMIAAYDSTSKYHNKADLLLQPRSFRMHLQTADNNMNPLKVPAEFVDVYVGQECFSTIDHDYDPLLPICMTDKANLITVHNFNEQCAFLKNLEYDVKMTFTNIKNGDDVTYHNYVVLPKGIIKGLGYENLYIYTYKSAGDGLAYNSSTGVITFDDDANNQTDCVNKIKVFNRTLTADELGEDGEYEDWTLLATVPNSAAFDVIFKVPAVQDQGSGKMRVSAVEIVIDDNVMTYNKAGVIKYQYSDLRNNYIVEVKHPLIHGLIAYLEESIGGKIRSLIKRERFDIPMIFSTQYMTLAQIFICAATPWITRVRLNSMKDVLYLEDNIGLYPYSKLKSLKEVPFKNYVNFEYTDYDSPLQTKIMQPTVAVQWILPEFTWKIGTGDYILPWYFNENDLDSYNAVSDDESNMSMPSIRSGVRLAALDTLYGMSEKDIRLSLDRLTKPFLRTLLANGATFYAYKYGRNGDGQIIADCLGSQGFSVFDLLASPRELGLCQDAPLGILTKDPADSGAYKSLTAEGVITSFRIKVWTNLDAKKNPDILSADGVNIRRAANYTQRWIGLMANGATSGTEIAGLVFGLNDEGPATFEPFGAIGTGEKQHNVITGYPTIKSLQRSLWTRIQMLPFVISPFDAVATADGGNRDIYDFAYMFGLAGFRASDYRESVYNREKEVVNQGMLFVDDPWVLASPIIKHGAESSGVTITKGYELK